MNNLGASPSNMFGMHKIPENLQEPTSLRKSV
jgi:hypothetical protein